MTHNRSSSMHTPIPQDGVRPELAPPIVEMLVSRPYDFALSEALFRTHFAEHHAVADNAYNDYRPVYRYGYDLGIDERYRHADWTAVEQAAQPPWEVQNPDTWAEFRDTIQFAWKIAQIV